MITTVYGFLYNALQSAQYQPVMSVGKERLFAGNATFLWLSRLSAILVLLPNQKVSHVLILQNRTHIYHKNVLINLYTCFIIDFKNKTKLAME